MHNSIINFKTQNIQKNAKSKKKIQINVKHSKEFKNNINNKRNSKISKNQFLSFFDKLNLQAFKFPFGILRSTNLCKQPMAVEIRYNFLRT
jgi:hypothetical protein